MNLTTYQTFSADKHYNLNHQSIANTTTIEEFHARSPLHVAGVFNIAVSDTVTL